MNSTSSSINNVPHGDGVLEPTPAQESAPAKADAKRTRHATRGQILILMAGAMVGLIGLLGLATDLGYGFVERRSMQNAADAGALAGAHTISKSDPAAPLTIIDDVRAAATANKVGGINPTVTSCLYVDDADESLGSCAQTVPPTASGVRVTVKETHNTFFLRIIPGGPTTMTTDASATAHTQQLATPPGDGPFLVCGVDTDTVSGPNTDILLPATGWQLDSQSGRGHDEHPHRPDVSGIRAEHFHLRPQSSELQRASSGNQQRRPHDPRLVHLRQRRRGRSRLGERQRRGRVHARTDRQLRGLPPRRGQTIRRQIQTPTGCGRS